MDNFKRHCLCDKGEIDFYLKNFDNLMTPCPYSYCIIFFTYLKHG